MREINDVGLKHIEEIKQIKCELRNKLSQKDDLSHNAPAPIKLLVLVYLFLSV